jgi:hypothetical protein
MCSDDLERAYSGRATYFGPGAGKAGWGFDPQLILTAPDTTEVEGVTVTPNPPSAPTQPVVIEPFVVTGLEIVQGVNPELTNIVLNAPIFLPNDFEFPANPTPSVQKSPAGVSLSKLNGMMKFQASGLASLAHTDGNEWGVIIYKDQNGNLHASTHFTTGSPTSINGARIYMPAGAVIVGYMHTHPWVPGVDQRMPSPASQGPGSDQAFVQGIIAAGKADPHMVTYILTPDSGASNSAYSAYAYDVDHLATTIPGSVL